MKWLLIVVVVVAAALFGVMQYRSVKTAYVNGLPAYRQLPGQEFIFERDCYIFKSDRHPTSWPVVASHEDVPELPAEVTDANLNKDFPGVRLLDVVRIGSRFRIVSVRRDESRHGTSITFEILFMDEADRKYPRLDAFYMLDHRPEKDGKAPVMLDKYAVQRVVR